MEIRPSGSGQKIGAIVLFSLGMLFFLCSLVVRTEGYGGEIDLSGLLWWRGFVAFSALSLIIGFLLLITGWIINAIYFLPGKEEIGSAQTLSVEAENSETNAVPETERAEPSGNSTTSILLIFFASVMGVLFIVRLLFKLVTQ